MGAAPSEFSSAVAPLKLARVQRLVHSHEDEALLADPGAVRSRTADAPAIMLATVAAGVPPLDLSGAADAGMARFSVTDTPSAAELTIGDRTARIDSRAAESAAWLGRQFELQPAQMAAILVTGAIMSNNPEVLAATLKAYPFSSTAAIHGTPLLHHLITTAPTDNPQLLQPVLALDVALDTLDPLTQAPALFRLVRANKPQMAITLLAQPAAKALKLEWTDNYSGTALYYAVGSEQLGVVRAICDRTDGKKTINLSHRLVGSTPLHAAAYPVLNSMNESRPKTKQVELIHALLLAGADPTIKNHYGETAAAVAKNQHATPVVIDFLERAEAAGRQAAPVASASGECVVQ